jgi:hypothetical protein
VGINLAIQDAVAAANQLIGSLLRQGHTEADLEAIQRRRDLPTRITQRLQVVVQDRIITRALTRNLGAPPLVARLLRDWPVLRRIPARMVGMGFRPEHVNAGRLPSLR